MKRKIYLVGPITGLEKLNYPEFIMAQELLNALGMDTVVPHDIFQGMDTSNFEHNDYMKHCIKEMVFCDTVVTLKDWELSKGAKMEVNIAREMGMEVIHIVSFLAKYGK